MKKESIEYRLLKKAANGGPIPPFTPEEEAVYPQLEFAKLIDVNVYSREWWLTAAGRIELDRLEKKRWGRLRTILWCIISAVITQLINLIFQALKS